ncbi:MAG: hypothetical protein A2919_00125 [Candidatus Spechtbacteria bacterium RIFCSPLOWO2_01_FULL_43_12]|uniref:Uncharacterized protein n=1 Tax=Candidatus Spechtbacteria bacterium RIFCSPLOWO2_01_FULL_43_12 TaxID=1802162 RepID=A0A1G2HF60_9BACT|nr:MAG: hypothetical protein A2919_00125 [Candidatus Spechtbacteria bacterium RIFCSPLOWO2_01_FULL_43_12]
MDNGWYRKKIELEVLQIIEKRLKAHQMNASRAKEIAGYILDTLHPQMDINQIHAVVQNFDDHFPELIPVVLKVSQDYEDRVKKVVTVYEGSRPKLVTRMPGSARMPADFEMRERETEIWQKQKQARVEELLEGGEMNNSEDRAYLTTLLGREPLTTTDYEENQRRLRLLEKFERTRTDIGRAFIYQNSESKPIGQRHLLLSEGDLKFYGISTGQAQEAFGRGWDEVAVNQLPKQNQGNPKP